MRVKRSVWGAPPSEIPSAIVSMPQVLRPLSVFGDASSSAALFKLSAPGFYAEVASGCLAERGGSLGLRFFELVGQVVSEPACSPVRLDERSGASATGLPIRRRPNLSVRLGRGSLGDGYES